MIALIACFIIVHSDFIHAAPMDAVNMYVQTTLCFTVALHSAHLCKSTEWEDLPICSMSWRLVTSNTRANSTKIDPQDHSLPCVLLFELDLPARAMLSDYGLAQLCSRLCLAGV